MPAFPCNKIMHHKYLEVKEEAAAAMEQARDAFGFLQRMWGGREE